MRLNVDEFHVGSRFFETMGIPLIRGREFDPRIDTGRELIVNENLARKLFGGAEPVGQVVGNNGKQYEIIGLPRNHKSRTIGEEPAVIAYHSIEQAPGATSFPPCAFFAFGLALCARTVYSEPSPRQFSSSVR